MSSNIWHLTFSIPTLTTQVIKKIRIISYFDYDVIYYIIYFKYIFEFFHILNKVNDKGLI
jgi:hypothetical protein